MENNFYRLKWGKHLICSVNLGHAEEVTNLKAGREQPSSTAGGRALPAEEPARLWGQGRLARLTQGGMGLLRIFGRIMM